jgi:uncharacterized membrane protein
MPKVGDPVPPVHELTRAIRSGEYASPKTVLGFFGVMIGIAATALICIVWLLKDVARLAYLVPIVLAVFIAIFLFVLISVMIIALKDPSKLMLGQISGSDYAEIQRMTLGDSSSGERVESVVVSRVVPAASVTSAEVVGEDAEIMNSQLESSDSSGEI